MTTVTTYSLDVVDRPDVLLRVISTCQRRRCHVVSVDYARGDRHRPARLRLSVEASDPRLESLLTEKLRGLVDVRSVSVESAPGSLRAVA